MASDTRFQAESFLDWQRRSGGTFEWWAASKDFSPSDRAAIRAEVERLRAEGWRPTSPLEALRRIWMQGPDDHDPRAE